MRLVGRYRLFRCAESMDHDVPEQQASLQRAVDNMAAYFRHSEVVDIVDDPGLNALDRALTQRLQVLRE